MESSGENNYRTHTLDVYTGCCAKSYPVPYNIFCEMIQNGIWLGGWYRNEQYLLKYRAFDGTEYENTLCEASNPCSLSLYGEMISNEIWEGGWVQESNGTIRYVQSLQIVMSSGSGSGSGHSSGISGGSVPEGSSGSSYGELEALGCSISAGSILAGHISTTNDGKIGEVRIAWTEGMTIGQNGLSVVTVSLVSTKNGFSFSNVITHTEWDNAYELFFNATFTLSNENTTIHDFISGNFIVPEQYRKYD